MKQYNLVLSGLVVFIALSALFPFLHVARLDERGATATAPLRGIRDETSMSNRSGADNQTSAAAAKDPGSSSILYHFVVNSGCSPYQSWQVLTQMHSAQSVGQSGRYTWIASGCMEYGGVNNNKKDPDDPKRILSSSVFQQELAEHFSSTDSALFSPKVHFTPDYSNMSVYGGPYADGTLKRTFLNRAGKVQKGGYGNTYHFNNKPNGLLHWAQQQQQHFEDNEVIVLIDPDFLFLKPLEDVPVSPGKPAAAYYGLGGQWLDFNRSAICGSDSLCTQVTRSDVNKYYTAGAPYLIHAHDVVSLAKKWAGYVPPTYDQYPLLYAEMYAYSMAAAHLNLPHRLIRGIYTGCMIPWPGKKDAGSPELSAKEYRESLVNGRPREPSYGGASSCFQSDVTPPCFLHYCNRYAFHAPADEDALFYFMAKRRVPSNILDCSVQDDLALATSNDPKEKFAHGSEDWSSLAACAITRAVNYARRNSCQRS